MDANEASDANVDAESTGPNAGTVSQEEIEYIRRRIERARARQSNGPYGFVYFIQGKPGTPVKIGFTSHNDVTGRIAGLQTGNPYVLTALYAFKGTMADERAIHKALAPERLAGEWFDCTGRFEAFYELLRREGLAAALEAIGNINSPDFPPEWDRLWTSETGAHLALSLDRTDILRKARLAGAGPAFRELPHGTNGRVARFYCLADLSRWLTANQIPHRRDDRYWRFHVIEVEPEPSPSPP